MRNARRCARATLVGRESERRRERMRCDVMRANPCLFSCRDLTRGKNNDPPALASLSRAAVETHDSRQPPPALRRRFHLGYKYTYYDPLLRSAMYISGSRPRPQHPAVDDTRDSAAVKRIAGEIHIFASFVEPAPARWAFFAGTGRGW